MAEFKVYYLNGRDLDIGERWFQVIEADSAKAAYKKFLDKTPILQREIHVEKDLSTEEFTDHFTSEKLKEQKDRAIISQEKEKKDKDFRIELKFSDFHKEIARAHNIINTSSSYLKLDVSDRVFCAKIYLTIAKLFTERNLIEIEIDYLRSWLNFKDREIGELLISKIEMAKPKSEQGKSKLAETITTGIFAGNMVKAHQLRELKELNESVDEIAEDVEEASGGFEE